MKLITCPKCHDVIKLVSFTRKCACGLTFGSLNNDGIGIISKEAIVIDLSDESYHDSIQKRNDTITIINGVVTPDISINEQNKLRRFAINYIDGDATAPVGDGPKIIAHVCNNIGAWGSGFVLAISRRWEAPELVYRSLKSYQVGTVNFVPVSGNIDVANMIAQLGLKSSKNPVPLSYPALSLCLAKVAGYAEDTKASVHMPRIGASRGGGDWKMIESIINSELIAKGVETYVYNYK